MEIQRPVGGALREKTVDILLLTGIFYINFISRIILGPLMPTVEKDLQIDHAQAGSLFLMISFGYFVTLATSGFINARIGHRRTLLLSAYTLGAALILVGLCKSLGVLQISLVVLGMSAGLYLPSAVATITDMVHPNHWGKALAIHELAPNLGLLLAPIIAEIFLSHYSWQVIVASLGVLSILAGLAFGAFSDGGKFNGEAPRFDIMASIFTKPSVWVLMIIFSLGVGGSAGVYNILPLFMITERGMDQAFVNTIIALSRISGLFMAFAAGWATDKIGEKRAIVFVLLITAVSTIFIGAASGWIMITMIVIQAAITACFFPPGLAAMARVGKPNERNVIVSCSIPVAYLIGGGAVPAVIGYMGDVSTFANGIILTGLATFIGPLLVKRLVFQDDDGASS